MTKIPAQYQAYHKTKDTLQKAYYYCHCQRVKGAFIQSRSINSLYCNCGGGFYKDIWSFITEKEVQVTLKTSLFDGDTSCQFEIRFSKDDSN